MRGVLALVVFAVLCGTATAEPQCTTESKDKWIGESEMKLKVAGLGYQVKVFKVTKGNCYEIYGLDKAGKRIEVYFHPVTGKIVEEHKS
jgi:hypothetical protein